MPLARFYQLVRVATKQKVEEEKNRLTELAWTAWQTTLPHWNKEPVMFDRWQEIIGLTKVISRPEDNVTAEEALSIAEKIMAADKKRAVN